MAVLKARPRRPGHTVMNVLGAELTNPFAHVECVSTRCSRAPIQRALAEPKQQGGMQERGMLKCKKYTRYKVVSP
jgi:hypothetical protein